MKKIISILIVLVVVLPQLINTWVLIDFTINHEYIAKVLCINKDKPEMKCNGKCHLAKQLNKTETKEKQNKVEFAQQNENLFVKAFEKQTIENIYSKETKDKTCFILVYYQNDFINKPFKPPKYFS